MNESKEREVFIPNDGCKWSPSCLDCPLPICKHDDPGWLSRTVRTEKHAEIVAMSIAGNNRSAIAKQLRVGTRTVSRVMSERRKLLSGVGEVVAS